MYHRSGVPAPAHKRRGARCLSSTSRCDGKRRRDGGCLVGIVAPDIPSSRHHGVRTPGKTGAAAVRERVRLNSAGVMRPFLGRLLRLQFIRLSRTLATEPARWWRAKGEDGVPNLRTFVRSSGRPTLAVLAKSECSGPKGMKAA